MPNIEYIKDADVDAAMDAEIRVLLTTCFLKPQDVVFKERRYFKEPPAHRWFIRDESGRLAAQVAVHDKTVLSGGRTYRIGGIAEVCVHPDHRGNGYVKKLLDAANEWLARNGFEFSVLFGRQEIYSSSGYAVKNNMYHNIKNETGEVTRKNDTPMVKPLGAMPWPEGEVFLPGPNF
ncbi:MAG: GNAT family N-acetyltransferase [Verrucomicrobia bacterium]|nr:GNAT family N-acetyltransferase [Verrucomicrobiota bacterium]